MSMRTGPLRIAKVVEYFLLNNFCVQRHIWEYVYTLLRSWRSKWSTDPVKTAPGGTENRDWAVVKRLLSALTEVGLLGSAASPLNVCFGSLTFTSLATFQRFWISPAAHPKLLSENQESTHGLPFAAPGFPLISSSVKIILQTLWKQPLPDGLLPVHQVRRCQEFSTETTAKLRPHSLRMRNSDWRKLLIVTQGAARCCSWSRGNT